MDFEAASLSKANSKRSGAARSVPPTRALRIAAAAVVAALVGACAPLGPPGQPAVVGVLPAAEPVLLSQVAANGLYEIEVSRLAASRATDPRVRSLAQEVASHRAHSRQQLAALMRARGLAVPARLPADKAAKLRRLQALRPSPQFDAAYVRVVGVEDHEAAILQLERVRRETRDAALASWIDRTLPVLKRDLQAARGVAREATG